MDPRRVGGGRGGVGGWKEVDEREGERIVGARVEKGGIGDKLRWRRKKWTREDI